MLFEEEKSYVRDMSKFHNPKIQKGFCHCGGQAKSTIRPRDEIV